jgi:hypothetical protein
MLDSARRNLFLFRIQLAMDQDKISRASENCLNNALQTNRPFVHVRTFIDGLKKDPSWSDSEIIELQTGVIRALMKRYGAQTTGDDAGQELDDAASNG